MSWGDDFLELMRKKKKEEEEEEEEDIGPLTETYKSNPHNLYNLMPMPERTEAMAAYKNAVVDVAPVVRAQQAEKTRGGLFDGLLQPLDDGWDQGDIMSIILETGDRIVDSDPVNWVGAKAMSGLSGFTSGIASTADLLLGKGLLQPLGWENNPISALADATKAEHAYFAQEAERYEQKMGGGAVLDFVGQAIEGVTGAIPSALLALMTGGTSAAGSAAATTGSLTNQALYQTGNILTKAGLSVESMMHNPQYWMSVAQTLGTGYEEAKAMGANDATAALGATFTSLINAGIENGTNGLSGIQGLPSEIAEEGGSKAMKWAISSIEEGGEEGLQKLVGEIITKTMYDQDAEILNPLEYAKDMSLGTIAGATLGGGQIGLQSASDALNSTGQMVGTNPLTKNEQAVVDKVYKDAVAESEAQKGKKLTAKEKNELYDAALEQMEKGYISTDTIEEVLGDRSAYDSLAKEAEEFKTLYNTASGQLSKAQQDRLAELEARNKENAYEELLKSEKGKFTKGVFDQVQGDRLRESYAERDRRYQAFQADLNKYAENQRATVQAAIDSGVLNNTNRSHEFVHFVAKLTADKGVPFNFADNAKLKETGFALEGVTVNGFVSSNGVTINVNSAKALNAVVGHEIMHVLEGTALSDSLATAIETYAKGKGDYDARLEQLTALYEGKEGYTGEDAAAKIEQEVVADLVGDYLFTDMAFVQQLSTEHRNVFQKVYDEVKYLCKVATAGSKEAKQLEKIKKMFAEVYRETGAKKPTGDGGVRYALSGQYDYSRTFAEQLEDYRKGQIPKGDTLLVSETPEVFRKIGMAALPVTLNTTHVDYALNGTKDFDHHLGKALLEQLPEAIKNPVAIMTSGTKSNSSIVAMLEIRHNGKQIVVPVAVDGFGKQNGILIDSNAITSVYGKNYSISKVLHDAIVQEGNGQFRLYYLDKNKATALLQKARVPMPKNSALNNGGYIHSLTDPGSPVKTKITSVEESQQFKRWFGDWQNDPKNSSKVVNADGTPKVVYHGTNAKFDTFHTASGEYWFSEYEDYAESMMEERGGGEVKAVYLDMKNPYRAKLPPGQFTDPTYEVPIIRNAKAAGHDGVIIENDTTDPLVAETFYVVFSPEQIKSATDNIGTFDGNNPNIRYSVSEHGPVADLGPVGWQVKGEDVALEQDDVGPVMDEANAEARTDARNASAEGRNASQLASSQEGSQAVSEYEALFPSEEDLMESEISEMDEEYRRLSGEEGYASQLYDSEEGKGVDTVARRLEVKRQNQQWELEANQRYRQKMIEAYDQKIAEAQAKYDAKKNKRTKVAEGLLRQIQRLQRLKADRLAEFDKRTADIEGRIDKLTKELSKDHSKQDRLEMVYKQIDKRMQERKAELDTEFDQRRQQLTEQVGNKVLYIKDQAQALYMELRNLKKGVRASAQLGYLKDAGFSWSEIRQALADVAQSPTLPVQKESSAESTVREMLLREYDNRQYDLADLDDQYQQEVKALEQEAEAERKAAQTANQRKIKQGSYEQEMAELAGDTSTWVDKKLGISYQTNTLRRNLRDVVRDADGNRDIEKADAIYDALQGSYNRNEAELNRETNRIKKPYAQMKINKHEDAYIQMLGEMRHNPDTKLMPWDVEEYYQKHKRHIDTAKVDKAIEMARETYDALLVRVNEVLREQGMQEIAYRKGYFPHFTEDKQGFLAKLLNWKTKNDEIPTDIAGLTEQFNPNRSWQAFNKERKSDTTDYSFLKGLDTYVQGSLDWIYHIEDIQKRRAFENHIRYVHSDEGIKERIDKVFASNQYDTDEAQAEIDKILTEAGNPLNNFVTDLRTGTNTLASKKSSMDRGMEQMTNRKVYSVMTNVSNRVSANMVAGSISSALTNFIPITQSWGQVSPKSSLRAIGDIVRSTVRNDGMVDKSAFLTNRLKEAEKLHQTGWDKASKAVGWFTEAVDSVTSQTVWRSKYLENMDAGMSEADAIRDADQFAENVMGGRSRGNMPTIFESKNPVTKLFTAFQLEVANQYGYMLKDMPQDMKSEAKGKLVAGYAKMFVGAYAYNALYSLLTGRDAAFDPIGIVEELLRDIGLLGDEEEEPVDVLMGFAENVMEELPFVGGLIGGGRIPISSALPYDGNVMDFIEGTGKLFLEGDTSELTEWLNPAYYLLPPMGGGQLRKTIQGLSMFSDEHPVAGSYTDSGDLRFPVEDTFGNRLKAGLFGQWANQNAQDYIENGRSPLSQERIEEFMETGMTIDEYWDYRDGLQGLSTLAEKADYIDGLDLTTKQKNILINNIADRDDPIDMESYEDYSSFEEFDYATKNPEKYAFLEDSGIGYEAYAAADEDGKRAYTWAYENPGKYTMSQAISQDFMTFYGYKQALNAIESDKDEDGNTISGSKKKKVIAYINRLNLDYGQKVLLYRMMYDSKKDKEKYNMDIIDYLNSRDDISYSQMETILLELGFEVDDEGYITWD